MTLGELAEKLGAELRGDPAREISGVATLDQAGPTEVSFLANRRYRRLLDGSRAGGVILRPEDHNEALCCLVTPNPYLAFARAVALLHPEPVLEPGVDHRAVVDPGAVLGAGVRIMAGAHVACAAVLGDGTILYPGVYVGRGVRIGRDCLLHANAVVREGCVLGDRVILQPGVLIGGDGFGFAQDGARHVKIPQVGTVVVEDDVEIGSGSAVDRAAVGETRIGRGTKIDNLVQIAHGVRVGEDCLLAGQVAVAGSARIGNGVTLAGRVGVVGHVYIGAGATVGATSLVTADVAPGAVLSGNPASDHARQLKTQALARRLPQLHRRLGALEAQVRDLVAAAAAGADANSEEEP